MMIPLQGELEILIRLGWYDGPLEGVLRGGGEPACWYFSLLAERPESNVSNDRLFALWRLSDADSLVLGTEFASAGEQDWYVAEAQASAETRRIVGSLPSALSGTPDVILRTEDFVTASDVWPVLPRDFYSGNAF
jgi:hypothetical protein